MYMKGFSHSHLIRISPICLLYSIQIALFVRQEKVAHANPCKRMINVMEESEKPVVAGN